MEVKVLIYIVIAAIYSIGWIMKKMKNKSDNLPEEQAGGYRQEDVPTAQSAKSKPLTFEELLRDITESKAATEPARPTFQPTYVDYDDNLEEEEVSLETIPDNYKKKDNIYEVYEEAKKAAFNRPSLEETMKLQDTDVKFGRFKVFEEETQNNVLDDYVRELQDPAGFKKAFVMSEVLKPKF